MPPTVIDISDDVGALRRVSTRLDELRLEAEESGETPLLLHKIEVLTMLRDWKVVSDDGLSKLLSAKLGDSFDAGCLDKSLATAVYFAGFDEKGDVVRSRH